MKLEGRIWKDEKTGYWVVYVPLLDISSQGRSRKAALAMIEDAIQVEAGHDIKIQAEFLLNLPIGKTSNRRENSARLKYVRPREFRPQ